MKRDPWTLLAFASLALLAFLVRIIPATFSSLPYNIDGFPLVKIAENIIETGGWRIDGERLILYNSKMPGVSMLLAAFHRVTGISPMQSIRFLLPLIGSTTVLSGGWLTYKVTSNKTAALGSAIFFAFSGFFVYLTSAAMKQVLGMALIPIVFLLFVERHEKKLYPPLLLIIMASMVLIHHLTFLILTCILILALFYSMVSDYLEEKTRILREVPVAVAIAIPSIFAWRYYSEKSLEHMDYAPERERMLLVMVFILWALLGSILFTSTDIEKRRRKTWTKIALVPLIFVCALLVNYYTPIFGVMSTTRLFGLLVIPYIILLPFPLVGVEVLRATTSKAKPIVLAGLLGPVVFITFAVTSGLDVISFGLLNRSFNYMDVSLGICAGIGFAYALKNATTKRMKSAIPAVLICITLLTLPLAYNGLQMYGVKDITEDHEFEALSVAAEIAITHNLTVYTDQRLGDILGPYFGVRIDRELPYTIHESKKLPSGLLLISTEWTSVGAQMYPFDNVVIREHQIDEVLENADVLFSIGPTGREIFLLSTVPIR